VVSISISSVNLYGRIEWGMQHSSPRCSTGRCPLPALNIPGDGCRDHRGICLVGTQNEKNPEMLPFPDFDTADAAFNVPLTHRHSPDKNV
jgi:hypothetical protein